MPTYCAATGPHGISGHGERSPSAAQGTSYASPPPLGLGQTMARALWRAPQAGPQGSLFMLSLTCLVAQLDPSPCHPGAQSRWGGRLLKDGAFLPVLHAMTWGSSTACESQGRGLLPDQGRKDPRSLPAGGELRKSGREGSLQNPQQGKGHRRILGATGRGTQRCPHRLSLGQRCPTGVCWVAQRFRTQARCALCRQHLGVSSVCLGDAPAGPRCLAWSRAPEWHSSTDSPHRTGPGVPTGYHSCVTPSLHPDKAGESYPTQACAGH